MLNKISTPMNEFTEWYMETYSEYPDFTNEPHVSEAMKQYNQQIHDKGLLLYLDEYEGSC
jgi:hypothetical protein